MVREQATRHAHKDLPIALTEVNTSYGMNTQPGALFAADACATLMANGVFTTDWWNVHNGPTSFSTIAGQPDCAGFGLLSSAGCLAGGTICQPALNTPFAPYHALAMTSTFAAPGQDPDAAKSVTLDYTGYTPAATAQVLCYTNGATGITTTTGGSAATTLPPYSLTTLVLRPEARSATPAAPARPTAITDHEATIAWTPSAPGVKHEVHRQDGATTQQWGETTGSSFTVHNLAPSTRCTVNVVARDLDADRHRRAGHQTEDNHTLAPGATATTGFVGAYQGPDVLPSAFTLNGTRCTTR